MELDTLALEGQRFRAQHRKAGSAACLPSLQTDTFASWKDAPPGSLLSKLLAFNLPAPIWPVNFLPGSEVENNASSSPLLQICCSGANCSALIRFRDDVCVNCPPQNRVGTAICSNPDASCLTT